MAKQSILFFSFLIAFTQCMKKEKTLFRLVSPAESGIDFINRVEEKDSINILTVQYMYHGGAVAIGDFNNDDLQDIFFSGNMEPNKLYLNRGEMKFEDVSEEAGIHTVGKWNAGVALADINEDGWLDIYVCATINDDPAQRENTFFIGQGLNQNGTPVFKDEAKERGVADSGYSQNAAFFDYDKDGDLDLYILSNLESDKIPSNYRPKILDGTALNNDKLYRNEGDGTFVDVTIQAGILIEGYGLGLGIADLNHDGWPDIYIGNDYVSNDVLYINNQDGTFTNQIKDRVRHQSLFSMGIDIADVNNDEFVDIITLDMLPENNLRRKTVSGAGATYFTYINNVEYGYEFQYMRNMLHVNQGDGTFQEVGQMAGIHQTEWSWSSLFMDVDNDGLKDLMITNGFPKDVTDKDYVMFKREVGAFNHQRSLIDSIPVLKVSNYGFKNTGEFSFIDQTKQWGLSIPSFSNGAAFSDLDNDGDLDYVVSNINDVAFLYENTLYDGEDEKLNNFFRIKLSGPARNRSGLGTKVTIMHGGQTQYHDHSIYRGYLSTVEDIIHFGVGHSALIDSVVIQWPDGKVDWKYNVKANQLLQVDYVTAHNDAVVDLVPNKHEPILKEVSHALGLTYKHKEWDKIDFYRQRTLPHKFSQSGPGLAVGDIDGDGLEDFIVGGSASYHTSIFKQQRSEKFTMARLEKTDEIKSEDEGILLFDADNDGDLDLYVVSGSYEGEAEESRYQDRLYKNDGQGSFEWDKHALPTTLSSGSCVRAADVDGDGDLDLFVGGRVIPGSYPLAPRSYLLINNQGLFRDETPRELENVGMVTDAIWTDFDNDADVDLMVVGEFMPITFFSNVNGHLRPSKNSGLENAYGWWNSIAGGDFDKDGDTDYIVGNLGLNNYYNISENQPLRVYAKDFDANGSIDAILSCYFKSEEGEMKEYPVHFWDELNGQSPKFRNQFNSYKQYGKATIEKLLSPYDTINMIVLKTNYAASAYVENTGNGGFLLRALPRMAQVSPLNGAIISDFNMDGNLDVAMVGNDYGNEVFSGRYDACSGLLLLGNGSGGFVQASSAISGLKVVGDAKGFAKLKNVHNSELYVATQNLDSLRVFRRNVLPRDTKFFDPLMLDVWGELFHEDGSKEKVEFYYGSGYLSQSTRSLAIPSSATRMTVYDSKGSKRVIQYSSLAFGLETKN